MKKSLTEDFRELTEYMAQIEQLLIFFADELEVIPNSGLSENVLEIMDRLKGVIIEGQIKRESFAIRLRNEGK